MGVIFQTNDVRNTQIPIERSIKDFDIYMLSTGRLAIFEKKLENLPVVLPL